MPRETGFILERSGFTGLCFTNDAVTGPVSPVTLPVCFRQRPDLMKYFKHYRLKVKGSMFLESFELLHLKSLKVLRTVYQYSPHFHSKINECN